MRNHSPQSLNKLFKDSSLKNIQAKSVALSVLNRVVCQLLPITVREHCRVANYRQGVLIIEVSSANWLTRLRYEQERLILTLRQTKLTGLASIQYKVNPELDKTKYILQSNQQDHKPKRIMTPQSASLLLALSENATPCLKLNLIRLANHATKLDNNKS